MDRLLGPGKRKTGANVFALSSFVTAVVLVLAALPAFAQPPQDSTQQLSQAAPAARAPRPDVVLKGDAVCTRCHDETEAYPVLAIGRTKHGTKADARTPTCTSCHGESPTHVSKPADATARPKVDRSFGRSSSTPAEERNAACLGCHEGKTRMFWHESTHASRDVTCASCHQVHTGHDKVRAKADQAGVCFECHKEQRLQVSKPSRHPILEGRVTCSDCHNPHGSPGPKMMVRGTINDTCFQCHAEKRGPFIWNHMPVTENCALCHNPHGTTVASMLKWRPPFLCQQCHESGHRGNVPTLTFGTGTGAMALGRACVNCHTNIHGGNHPEGGQDARSLRR